MPIATIDDLLAFLQQHGAPGAKLDPASGNKEVGLPDAGFAPPALADFLKALELALGLNGSIAVPDIEGFPGFNGVSIRQLQINPRDKEFSMEVGWDGTLPLFSIGDLSLEIGNLTATLASAGSDGSRYVRAMLRGQVTFAGATFDVTAEPNERSLSARLHQEPDLTKPRQTISLHSLFKQFGAAAGAFDDASITGASLIVERETKTVFVALSLDEAVTVGGFDLASVTFTFLRNPGWTRVGLIADGWIDEVDIDIAASYDSSTKQWGFAGVAARTFPIPVGQIAESLLDRLGLVGFSLPKSIAEATISDVTMTFQSGGGDTTFQFALDFEGQPEMGSKAGESDIPAPLTKFKVENADLYFNSGSKSLTASFASSFTIAVSHDLKLNADIEIHEDADNHKVVRFTGKMTLAERTFDIVFDHDAKKNAFAAVYSNPGGEKLDIGKLIEQATGINPGNAELKVKDVCLVYEPTTRAYAFAIDMDAGIDLSGLGRLPLIGKLLPKDQALGLAFKPIFVSKTAPDSSAVALLPAGGPILPATLSPGFQFTAEVRFAGLSKDLEFGKQILPSQPASGSGLTSLTGKSGLGSPQPPANTDAEAAQRKAASDLANTISTLPKDDVKWIDLQKHFGPLHVERLGLAYKDSTILVLLDAGLAIGPLAFELDGLGASYNLNTHSLHFFLDGLGIDFATAALTVSAAFLRFPGDQFAGKAMLRMETLSLGALGAYQEVDGHPSLFLYAFIDYPIGGPTFFFVEGLAVGFGYNRRLIVPPIEQIYTFPLVAEVVGGAGAPKPPTDLVGPNPDPGKGVGAEMNSLVRYIPAEIGQYFICAGIKFNSFRIIDGFALLAGSFGKEFEIDLLGILALKLPTDSPEVMAEIEMEFAARVVPLEGFISAQAQLTPRSYILSRQCSLQGGFACAAWLLGEHAGDFVYSMGGYHPRFNVPAHYPRVPRLAFHWRIDSNTSMKGSMYYALTPGAAMAGGSLEASWSTGDVDAWFSIGLDILMQWKPYHYDATGYAEIGAHVNIDVPVVGRVRVSINAGAEVEMWGPELAGRAHVHVKVMGVKVNFTVDFRSRSGHSAQLPTWKEVQDAFLPGGSEHPKTCCVAVRGGLIETAKTKSEELSIINPKAVLIVTESEELWVINPKEFLLVTDTLIPVTGEGMPPFGVVPLNRKNVKTSSHDIKIFRDKETKPSDQFTLTPIYKFFAPALWGKSDDPKGLIGGYEIRPKNEPAPGNTQEFKRAQLAYTVSAVSIKEQAASSSKYVAHTQDKNGFQGDLSKSAPARRDMLAALKINNGEAVAFGNAFAGAFTPTPQSVEAA